MISQGELIFAILSIALIAAGLFSLEKRSRLLKKGKKVKGIVYSNNFKMNHRGDGLYYPVIRFLTEKNEWMTQELNIGTNRPMKEREEIEVLYDPASPTDMMVNSGAISYVPYGLIAIGSCLFLVVLAQLLGMADLIK